MPGWYYRPSISTYYIFAPREYKKCLSLDETCLPRTRILTHSLFMQFKNRSSLPEKGVTKHNMPRSFCDRHACRRDCGMLIAFSLSWTETNRNVITRKQRHLPECDYRFYLPTTPICACILVWSIWMAKSTATLFSFKCGQNHVHAIIQIIVYFLVYSLIRQVGRSCLLACFLTHDTAETFHNLPAAATVPFLHLQL